ncbi:MAG: hypothetical protein ABIQ07_03975 [Ginsengibacter sp.]
MKHFKSLSAVMLMAGSLFFSSCNDDETKTDDTTVTDTTAITKMETPAKPANILIIMQKVANYSKWKPGYDSHDSVRLVYGLHNNLVARGLKDSNMVMVVLAMDDTAKAKQFVALPDLKMAMQKAGVIGKPTFRFIDMQVRDTTNAEDTRVIMTHKVKDWDTWKKVFDSHKQARMDAGLTDRAVGYAVGDPTTVTVALIIHDMQKAEAFMNSKDLKDKMAEAGVVGAPDVFFYKVAQQY